MWLPKAALARTMASTPATLTKPSVSLVASALWPLASMAPVSWVLMCPSGVHTTAS